jgi:hypothetical protein
MKPITSMRSLVSKYHQLINYGLFNQLKWPCVHSMPLTARFLDLFAKLQDAKALSLTPQFSLAESAVDSFFKKNSNKK